MKNLFIKIWPYVTISAVIAVGTVIFKAGIQTERNDQVITRLNELSKSMTRTEDKLDSLSIYQQSYEAEITDFKKALSEELSKTNQKLECIVNTMPNKDSLRSQFYDIERQIVIKNDMFDLLIQRNEIKKKEIQSLTGFVLKKSTL